MQKVGEILKAEREKKGVSLHEVGMALKINPKILKAIEEGDKNHLPAKTFLVGFLKSYSQYLKLNPAEILSAYYAETAPEPVVSPSEPQATGTQEPLAPLNNKPKEEKITPLVAPAADSKKIISVVVSVVLVIIIIFLAKIIDKYQKEAHRVEVEATKPIEPSPAAATEESALPNAAVGSDPLSTIIAVAPTNEPKADRTPITSDKKETSNPVAESPSAEKIKEAPQNEVKPEVAKPEATAAEPAKTEVTKAETTNQATEINKPAPKPTEVIIEALNKVEVKYSFDGKKYDSVTLAADQIHTFKSKSLLNLEISDGGAINIIVNGRDKGVPGTLGRPLKLSYPK